MTYADSLYSYRNGVASGSFDTDLDEDARRIVVGKLDMALNILWSFGGTDSATLTRQTVSTMSDPWDIVTRVSDILAGCAGGYYQARPSVYTAE